MKKKVGAPSKGRKGKHITFNCWPENIAKAEELAKKRTLSEVINRSLKRQP